MRETLEREGDARDTYIWEDDLAKELSNNCFS